MSSIKTIESKISKLSPNLMEELNAYLDYLTNKKEMRKPKKLKQTWAGGLSDVKMSAMDLQKKALEWRRK